MSTLMNIIIERLKAIPEEEQGAYAAAFLSKLEDDQHWEQLFAGTTEKQWKQLADQAREEMETGESRPLSELIHQS